MQLAIVAGVGMLLAAALGAIVARTALKPIRRFTSTTEAADGRSRPLAPARGDRP